jgi:hypothetical protein
VQLLKKFAQEKLETHKARGAVMKKTIIACILMILFSTTGVASEKTILINQAMTGYIRAIRSDNTGLQMSGMQNLIKLKLQYPDFDYNKAIKTFAKIIKKDKNSMIRVCATITHALLTDANLLKFVKDINSLNPLTFFNMIFQKLNTHLSLEMIESYS